MIDYNIDLTVDADYSYTLPGMKQYDSESRTLKIRLLGKNGEDILQNSRLTCNFRALKPDGNVVYSPAQVVEGKAVYTLSRQVLTAVGTVLADIEVKDGERVVLSSQMIAIDVEPSALSAHDLESTSDVSALGGIGAEAITKANLIAKVAKSVEASAEQIKAKANEVNSAVEGIQGAERSRVEAERQRVNAEQARSSAEQTRTQAESQRTTNEEGRVRAEQNRTQAEGQRFSAFSTFEQKSGEWQQNETNRKSAETRRVKAEESRERAEALRIQAENDRKSVESERVSKDAQRTSTFAGWENAFSTYADNENARQRNETARVSAEELRARQFATDHERATQDIAKTQAVLENIKRLESGQLVADVAEIQTTYATKKHVDDLIANLIGGASENLDTLKELADVLTGQGGEIQGLVSQLALKLPKDEAERLLAALEQKLTALINAKASAADVASAVSAKVNTSDFDVFKRTTETSLSAKANSAEFSQLKTKVENDMAVGLASKINQTQILTIEPPLSTSGHWVDYQRDEANRQTSTYRADGVFTSNLIEGTLNFSGSWTNTSGWENAGTFGDFTVKKKTRAWGGMYKPVQVTAGKTYVFSVYIRRDTAGQAMVYLTDSGNAGVINGAYSRRVDVDKNWQRIIYQFVAKTNGTVHPNVQTATNDAIYICGYCLVELQSAERDGKLLTAASTIQLIDRYNLTHLTDTYKRLRQLEENPFTQQEKTKLASLQAPINSLESTSTTAPLTAAQGKVLKEQITTIGQSIGSFFQTVQNNIPTGFKGVKVVSNDSAAKQSGNSKYLCLILEA